MPVCLCDCMCICLSLSLSLSHPHTHTHIDTDVYAERERERERTSGGEGASTKVANHIRVTLYLVNSTATSVCQSHKNTPIYKACHLFTEDIISHSH